MNKYSRIFNYLKAYRGNIVLYFICILVSTIFSVGAMGMLAPFFDIIFMRDNETSLPKMTNPITDTVTKFLSQFSTDLSPMFALGFICIVIITTIFLKNLFLYLSFNILNPIKNKIIYKLRSDLYEKILRLPIGFFTEKRKGDLISRVTNDVSEVEGSMVGALEGWVRDPITILINFAVLFWMSPELTLTILVSIPVVGFILGRISRSLKRTSNEAAEKLGESLSILDETLNGLRVIKAFNVENLMKGRYNSVNEELYNVKNKISRRRDMAAPTSEVLGVLVFVGILWFGGRQVLNDELLSPSLFLAYLAMFYNVINPVKSLSTSFSNMQKGSAAIVRIEEVLNTTATVDDNPGGKILPAFKEGIEFRNAGFAYDDSIILKDINFTIGRGKTIALVGSSGAGKSTLADLVPRFHDVSSGEVLIDGINIKDYQLHSVRDHISIVTQEPILFNDTIAANIALGRPGASRDEIIQAAKIANAHNFIMAKEGNYDSNIGDRGSKLSGGERQRLTIARAVLKNPPILILDEATSSLDTESEMLVQGAINNLMTDRTSIVIAHRLSTVRHADEIIVLQKGTIAERGTHEELMAVDGMYRKLVTMQEVK